MRRTLLIVVVVAVAAFAVWLVATDRISPTGDSGNDAGTGTGTGTGTGQPIGQPGIPVPADAETMVVVSIHDGDTLNLRDSSGSLETVRIIGVDTPEIYPQYECFGDEATDELNRLAPVGSSLRVTVDADAFDDYDRLLLYLWNSDGVFVNLALVEGGFAEAIRVAPNDLYYDALLAAENSAAHDGLGMWSC